MDKPINVETQAEPAKPVCTCPEACQCDHENE